MRETKTRIDRLGIVYQVQSTKNQVGIRRLEARSER